MNWIEIITAVFIVLGGLFMLIGSVGLSRLPDFYMRLHAPTKATTLGIGSLLIASMIFFSYQNSHFSIHEILVTLFLFITAPVSAHMMAKAAIHVKTRSRSDTQGLESKAEAERRNVPSRES